jgi:cysteine desulfurase
VGLVSVQATNNELGVRQPLGELRAALGAASGTVLLHTDAVQALGRTALDLRGWGIDLAALAAHKLGGPLGVGVLVRRRGVELEPLMFGGGQEGGLRPGTEDPVAIACGALAVALAVEDRAELEGRLRALEDALRDALVAALPGALLLGPPLGDAARQPGTLNVFIPDLDGKVLVTRLDLAGLEVSAGSACASGSLEPSHVLRAIGLDERAARAGVRLTLGRDTTRADIQQAVDILRKTFG